jgi:nucleoside-diphosphate-sugar epimerase
MKNYFKNKHILITGGAGFIGSNLAIKLIKLGAKVTIVDSMIENHGGNLFNLNPIKSKIHLNFSDIRDINSLKYIVKKKDIIYSLAGQVSHIESMKKPFIDLNINSKSQLALLETCRQLEIKPKIIYASTRQIYGKPKYLPVDETHPLKPVDINGIHKLSAEQYYTLYNKIYDFQTVILRFTNIFGERMLIKSLNQGFLPIWIGKALKGEIISIYGEGNQLRDFNYVDDIVDTLIISAFNKNLDGKIFNIGDNKHYSLKQVSDIIKSVYPKSKFKFIDFPKELKKIDIGDFYTDYTKFSRLTKWQPKFSLQQGLKKTFKYYLKYKEYYL